MLNEGGKETFEFGMDSSISLNSNMITDSGKSFLDEYYDSVIKMSIDETKENLMLAYKEFSRKT